MHPLMTILLEGEWFSSLTVSYSVSQQTLHVANPKQKTAVHIMFKYDFQTPELTEEVCVCENLWR